MAAAINYDNGYEVSLSRSAIPPRNTPYAAATRASEAACARRIRRAQLDEQRSFDALLGAAAVRAAVLNTEAPFVHNGIRYIAFWVDNETLIWQEEDA